MHWTDGQPRLSVNAWPCYTRLYLLTGQPSGCAYNRLQASAVRILSPCAASNRESHDTRRTRHPHRRTAQAPHDAHPRDGHLPAPDGALCGRPRILRPGAGRGAQRRPAHLPGHTARRVHRRAHRRGHLQRRHHRQHRAVRAHARRQHQSAGRGCGARTRQRDQRRRWLLRRDREDLTQRAAQYAAGGAACRPRSPAF